MKEEEKYRYRILWLEDEPDKLAGFPEACKRQGFDLIHCPTGMEAAKVIEKEQLDGAILDVRGDVGDSSPTDEGGALTLAHDAIKKWQADLPRVVLTAQKSAQNPRFVGVLQTLRGIEVFQKTSKGQKDLFIKLKELIEKRPQSGLRKKYSEVFSFCEKESELGVVSLKCLEHCLLHIEYGQELGGLQPYNDLRQIVERLARVYKERGLLPDEFGGGQVKMTDWIHFWCGTHRDYQFEKCFPFLPSVFSKNLIHLFTRIGNAGSHPDQKEGEAEQRELVNGIADATDGDHHLIHIATYLTIDLLKMAKVTVEKEQYSDREANQELWSEIKAKVVKGKLVKNEYDHNPHFESDGGEKCFIFSGKLEVVKIDPKDCSGCRIEVEIVQSNKEDGYPYKVKKVRQKLDGSK